MGGCFPCFGSSNKGASGAVKELNKKETAKDGSVNQSHHVSRANSDKSKSRSATDVKKEQAIPKDGSTQHIAAQTFTFKELANATKNFRPESLLGEGGFGRVYKGRLESTGQIVAVKQLDRNGLQGNREFLVEVLMLSLLHHPNLVNLIGYCADGDQRLLVYEFMPLGSLEDHLHDLAPDKPPLDWNTRMKIAAGAAKGLEYLHDKANPPVIYRDLKSSNILLDEGFHPKLSDFGLAKLGPVGDKTHVSTRVMGTYGYCAPEYAMTGQLTLKSDVYSFGVVFLELITGRKAIDNNRAPGEHNLVAWARPLFKDRRKFPKMADPLLQGHYPMRGLYQALAVAAMCLQEQAATRPLIGDVVTALSYLASQTYDTNAPTQSNRGGPSPRSRDEQRDGLDSTDERGRFGSPSTHKNSPDNRIRDHIRNMSSGTDLSRNETGGGSGRRWGLDDVERQESQRGSPASNGRTPRNRDLDRERAVAEAKVWGENWREKKRANAMGSFDATNERGMVEIEDKSSLKMGKLSTFTPHITIEITAFVYTGAQMSNGGGSILQRNFEHVPLHDNHCMVNSQSISLCFSKAKNVKTPKPILATSSTVTQTNSKPSFRDIAPQDINVLVVGSTGYIGKFVVKELLNRGFNVIAIAREKSGIKGGTSKQETLNQLKGANVHFSDVSNLDTLNTSLRDLGVSIDVVVSCLASRTGGVKDSWKIDYEATKNSLLAGRNFGASHFVLLSAICVQKPLLEFQRAKLKFEAELMEEGEKGDGFTYSIVRPTAFFKSLAGQVELVKDGKPYVMFGDGKLCACKPISEKDLASFISDCVLSVDMINKVLPIGGPGKALTPLEQGEMLYRLVGKEPKFLKVPIGIMDFAIGVLDSLVKIFPQLEDAAEFGKIGRYYAAESMLILDPQTGEYSAEKTPSYGKDTLEEFFEKVLRDGMSGQELGEQAFF
ncbi:hypothetical protein ACFE04_006487 [Oxalis oulophora]